MPKLYEIVIERAANVQFVAPDDMAEEDAYALAERWASEVLSAPSYGYMWVEWNDYLDVFACEDISVEEAVEAGPERRVNDERDGLVWQEEVLWLEHADQQ